MNRLGFQRQGANESEDTSLNHNENITASWAMWKSKPSESTTAEDRILRDKHKEMDNMTQEEFVEFLLSDRKYIW